MPDRWRLRTLEGWLSASQWRSVSAALRGRVSSYQGGERRGVGVRRVKSAARCLLRVEHRGRSADLYLARTRNVSRNGLCVLQGVGLNPWSRVTVMVELPGGISGASFGVVSWCRPIFLAGSGRTVYEVGIELDGALDESPVGPL